MRTPILLFSVLIVLMACVCVCSLKTSNVISWKRPHWKIHYEAVNAVKSNENENPPLLLLPGFGVGTFHYEKQLEELGEAGYRVFTCDFFGQGKSWPEDHSITEDDQLCYSTDLWKEQVIHFIENVIKEPCHVLGNSLGGYLSVLSAAERPELFKSLILCNAAPFWAFAPSVKEGENSLYQKLNIWNGTLPAPKNVYSFGSSYFYLIKSESTVKAMLQGVYSTPHAYDEKLVDNIITAASRQPGYEAFTSILFSPKAKRSFDQCLEDVRKEGVPVCLLYGKDDPWVVPYWGQRAKRILQGAANYMELSPCGHSPNHESPRAVNAVLKSWMNATNEWAGKNGKNGKKGEREGEGEGEWGVDAGDTKTTTDIVVEKECRDITERQEFLERQLQGVEGPYLESFGDKQWTVSASLTDGAARTLSEKLFLFFDEVSNLTWNQ